MARTSGRRRSHDASKEARRIGPYEVLGRFGRQARLLLGRGADGELAVLRTAQAGPALGAREGWASDAFLRRARTLSAVEHPGLVAVQAVGVAEGCPFAAERFYGGGSLTGLLRDLRTLPLEEARARGRDRLPGSGSFEARAAALGARLAEALAALHGAGLAHGRVQPSAVLFDDRGRVLLGGVELESGPRAPGEDVYLAPEGFDAAAPTAAGDLFALGAVLYELLALCPPFDGRERGWLARRFAPAPPRRLQPFLSKAAEAVLLQALEPRAGRRPASAAALARDLYALAAGAAVTARPPSRWRRALSALRGRGFSTR